MYVYLYRIYVGILGIYNNYIMSTILILNVAIVMNIKYEKDVRIKLKMSRCYLF